jgi:hypothetical protein
MNIFKLGDFPVLILMTFYAVAIGTEKSDTNANQRFVVSTGVSRVRVMILELLALTSCIGLTGAFWCTSQERGMIAGIVLTTIAVYYLNRMRVTTPFLPTSLLALPMLTLCDYGSEITASTSIKDARSMLCIVVRAG